MTHSQFGTNINEGYSLFHIVTNQHPEKQELTPQVTVIIE